MVPKKRCTMLRTKKTNALAAEKIKGFFRQPDHQTGKSQHEKAHHEDKMLDLLIGIQPDEVTGALFQRLFMRFSHFPLGAHKIQGLVKKHEPDHHGDENFIGQTD